MQNPICKLGRITLKEFNGAYPYIGRCKNIKLIKWNMHKKFVYQGNEGGKVVRNELVIGIYIGI